MPVWHNATLAAVKSGKLVLLGVTQEQHPERCRLFAQWKQFDWPILHDPINVLASSAVPIVLALDEHGIVRSTRPNPKTFAADFLDKTYADDARNTPAPPTPAHPPKFDALKPTDRRNAAAWRKYGDALALWGSDAKLTGAIDSYTQATRIDAKDAAAWFRLGVCLRRRSETPDREESDFRKAVEAWGTALDLDPNQYIWRRRIEQYGPRLEKPYPFYDWVPEAEAAIRKRGQTPIALPVRPGGAEIAKPSKTFAVEPAPAQNPDPQGKINRDPGSVTSEVVIVPATIAPGKSARVHVVFRLVPKSTDHWNNEAEPLRVWLDPPVGVAVSKQLLEAEKPAKANSTEERPIGFEVQIPRTATGTVRIPAYALYHICDDAGGQCRFVRLDVTIEIKVK